MPTEVRFHPAAVRDTEGRLKPTLYDTRRGLTIEEWEWTNSLT